MSKNKVSAKTPSRKIFAAERQIGGAIKNEYIPTSKISFDTLLMIRKEPTIKIGLWFYNTIIASGLRDYIHPNEEIQQFVRENMTRIRLRNNLKKMLSYRWVGASVMEMVWDYLDGKWQLMDLVYLRPNSWYDKGLPLSPKEPIIQKYSGSETIEVPCDKCVILRNSTDYEEDASIIDSMLYKHWSKKMETYDNWNLALEQFAKFKIEVEYEQGTGLYGPDGKPIDEAKEAEHYAEKAEAFRNAKSFAHDSGLQVTTNEPPKSMGTNFIDKLSYDDKMMLRGMIMPALLIQGNDGGVGSNATSETHYKLFWKYMQADTNWFENEIRTQMVIPLINYNFPNVKEYGHFNVDDIELKDYTEWKDILLGLTNMGVLTPSVNRTHRKKALEIFNLMDGIDDVSDMLDNSIIPSDEYEK